MKTRIPLRTVIGLSGIVILSLYHSASSYPSEPERDPYRVATVMERFQPLQQDVAPTEALAYVSDTVPDEATIFAIQYALAPRFLVRESQPHRLVVGNFRQPVDYQEFGRSRGLAVLKEYPQGVVLFEAKRQ